MSTGRPLDRRHFLRLALGAAAGAPLAAAAVNQEAKGAKMTSPHPKTARMPVLFVGHGSPMNAIEDNPWSRGFQALGQGLPKPKAIVAVSAHWYVPGTYVTGNERPETIHDFGGFPQALFDMRYPAPGDPALARRIVGLIGAKRASLRDDWGLDHGTWSVLHHLRPDADVPVVQLSIDGRLPAADHVTLGRAMAPLRDEGVLILASGNMTHNLRHAMRSFQTGDLSTPEWAAKFDREVAKAAEQRDVKFLTSVLETDEGRLSHPTPDHYLPLLYAVGASAGGDPTAFPISGFDGGSLSMRSVLFG